MNKEPLKLKMTPDDDFRYTEAIKTLRTNIMFSGSDVTNVMFTSTQPNEGKSTISFDVARAFAESGKKTLYLDADVRKSVFALDHDITVETVGLTQLLTKQVEMEDCVYSVEGLPELELIIAGPYAPNATELFEDKMCDKLFEFIKSRNYDKVIIDTPPIGTVIDAAILARYADGAILLAASEQTSRRVFLKCKQQLERTGVRFLGAVLNKVKMSKSGYYRKYYKYDSYGYYGKSGKEQNKE